MGQKLDYPLENKATNLQGLLKGQTILNHSIFKDGVL
jgi:hypothetical protein